MFDNHSLVLAAGHVQYQVPPCASLCALSHSLSNLLDVVASDDYFRESTNFLAGVVQRIMLHPHCLLIECQQDHQIIVGV
jgi:hypothetical protein